MPNDPEAWRDHAACTGTDTDLFFPERGWYETGATDVCRSCPVMLQCCQYALSNNIDHGTWGGLSTRQRRRLRTWRTKAHREGRSFAVAIVDGLPAPVIDGVPQQLADTALSRTGRKLCVEDVRQIRALRAAKVPVIHIAEEFRVSDRAVRNVLRGDTWGGVA